MAAVAAADVDSPAAVAERLEAFASEVLADAISRPVQMVNGERYLRGLGECGQSGTRSVCRLIVRLRITLLSLAGRSR